MALSNWDTLAIGPDGKSVAGGAKFGETEFYIYKNWLHVDYKSIGFHIDAGQLHVGDITIDAKRHNKQRAVFILIHSYDQELLKKEKPEYKKIYFGGIGCYGYDDLFKEYCEKKGVDYIPYNYSTNRDGKEYVGWFAKDEKGGERLMEIENGFDLNPWVGVKKETLDEFKVFLLDALNLNEGDKYGFRKDEKAWFDSISWDELLRFNQGDAFFGAALGTDVSATTIGEPTEPMAMQMIKDIKDK